MRTRILAILKVVVICCPLFVEAQIITTIAGGGSDQSDSIPALSAQLVHPNNIVFDANNNMYINSGLGHKVLKINDAGIITTIAGTGSSGYNGDGGLAETSMLNNPGGICLDSIGNVFIADNANFRVRKVEVLTGIITTVAGNGVLGYNGEGILATNAQLSYVLDVYFDKAGNLFIGEAGDAPRIRKVDPNGIITTYVGTGVPGYSGDGGLATLAQIGLLADMITDSLGNLYFSDFGTDINCIRKVDLTTNIITTIAGTTDPTYNGDNIPATTANITPLRMSFDKVGELYFADWLNNRLRKIDANGIIHTIAGDGVMAYSGDGGPAMQAQLNRPATVIFDSCGNLYMSETTVGRVRKITYNDTCSLTTTTNNIKQITSSVNAYPNPTYSTLTITSTTELKDISLVNMLGQQAVYQNVESQKAEVDVSHLANGVYFLTVTDANGAKMVKKIVKE